jgi:hypothetical protein
MGAVEMLESRGTGREVDSSDRVGIFDRQLKVERKRRI